MQGSALYVRHSGARKCSVCKALWCKEVLYVRLVSTTEGRTASPPAARHPFSLLKTSTPSYHTFKLYHQQPFKALPALIVHHFNLTASCATPFQSFVSHTQMSAAVADLATHADAMSAPSGEGDTQYRLSPCPYNLRASGHSVFCAASTRVCVFFAGACKKGA